MIPEYLLVHTASVEEYQGSGSKGDVYAAPYSLPCMIESKPTIVRDANGEDAIASALVFADPRPTPIPPGSRVTYFGTRVARVITVAELDDDGLTGLDHIEIALD
jgi:hypothetical protein